MAEIPVIQLLEKEHYFTQHILSCPHETFAPLAPGFIRVKTRVLSLTANNFSYARLGFLLGWWDIHRLPYTTPAPYDDSSKYGRISAWGFAEVLESTYPSVAAGGFIFGYLPIGNLALDLQVEGTEIPTQFIVTSPHRAKAMPIYNRYVTFPAFFGDEIDSKTSGVAYDSLIRIMFETAYLMVNYALAPDPANLIPPGNLQTTWDPQRADIAGATVVVFAPGSKVGLCFAHLLKGRDSATKPRKVVGAASEFSRDWVAGLGLYDDVVLTSEAAPAEVLSSTLGAGPKEKVVLVDFGGRGGVADRWAEAIMASAGDRELMLVRVGSEIVEASKQDTLAGLKNRTSSYSVGVNASDMREQAMKKAGEVQYWAGFDATWSEFKKEQQLKGLNINWRQGMDEVAKGWERLSKGEVGVDEGLLFSI